MKRKQKAHPPEVECSHAPECPDFRQMDASGDIFAVKTPKGTYRFCKKCLLANRLPADGEDEKAVREAIRTMLVLTEKGAKKVVLKLGQPNRIVLRLAFLLALCAFSVGARAQQWINTDCIMWPWCNYTITSANVENYTNSQMPACYAAGASWGMTNPVPVTITTYPIKNLDGSMYDTGINISWHTWPTNTQYEFQWTTNLNWRTITNGNTQLSIPPVWYSTGVGGWPTNSTACYSGPMRSAKCPVRFFRVMSGPGY